MTSSISEHDLVLAVDLGTGGPKIGFATLSGELIWQSNHEVTTTWLPGNGATQNPNDWWAAIVGAVQEASSSGVVDLKRVRSVAVTGQWGSTVPTTIDGLPAGDCILWMDKRAVGHLASVVGGPVAGHAPITTLKWIRKSAGVPSPAGGDPVGHMLVIEKDLPEVSANTAWYLEPADHLTMRFTGKATTCHATMAAAWLTDNRHLDRLAYDSELVALAGINADRLPPLVRGGTVVGEVRPEVVAELGLGPGVQVVTGTNDLQAAAFGAGSILDFEAHLAISTTSWISAPVPFKKTDAINGIATVPAVAPMKYLIANSQDTGGRALQWLREVLATEGSVPSFDELTAQAATASAGSGKVIFTPWLNGERSPLDDRDARGGFHNVSLQTTRADLTRAVLEGVAYNSRLLFKHVEKLGGQRFDNIRMIGGGATSDLWCQIMADVLDRTIERTRQPVHAQLRGAALLAGVATGVLNVGDVRSQAGTDGRFEPNPQSRDIYDSLFAEFPKLYKGQKGTFSRLNGRES